MMRDLIRKLLKEELDNYVKKIVISEMAAVSGYCKKSFSIIGPELPFCEAAENYIKNEIETVGRTKTKVIFDKFKKGVAKFAGENYSDEELEIKIEKITNNHPLMIQGVSEIENIKKLIGSNCPNIDKVFKRQMDKFKNTVQLYFREGEEYSNTNRLDTNYSAIAVLFTKFFSHKGALDSTELNIDDINWDKIAMNWINHSFNPSIKFHDIRRQEDKEDRSQTLTNLDFNELCKIYFTNVITFGSYDIRKSVNDVLTDVRSRGFESENEFEKKYLINKREFQRIAKDYGFGDRFLGIDFIYKGKDFWIPVQVKSSPQEATYLISSLGCKTYVVAEKTGKTFKNNTLHSGDLIH